MSYLTLTRAAPEDAGMNSEKLKSAMRLLDKEVEEGNIPGATAVVARKGKIIAEHAVGWAEKTEEQRRPMDFSAIFDLASLTKVMATLPAILLLLERGLIRLKDPVSLYIPEFAAQGKEEITIRHLLTHTSGLVAHRAMYTNGWGKNEILKYIWEQPAEYPPGSQMVYSDLGFITLGIIVEAVTGLVLNEFVKNEIYHPLGMKSTYFLPPKELKGRMASTEFDESLGRYKLGEVHDDNAYALGGVSGHAGLFAPAADVAIYGQMWLNGGAYGQHRLFSPITVKAATTGYTPSIEGANRGLGWVLKDDAWDASGDLFSPSSYGHTGFTGTSITCDPENDLLVVLLTNRVHFGRERSIVRLRSVFHNAVVAGVEN
jgi:CubicO group peptidase (beta-lactamase class C family)